MKKSDALLIQVLKMQEEEARREALYGEDLPNGSVIAFTARFVARGKKYDYCAIRVADLWFTTGPNSPKGYTWDELTLWLDGMFKVTRFTTLRTANGKN